MNGTPIKKKVGRPYKNPNLVPQAVADLIRTQSIEIKKQKLSIEILVRIVDQLRRPYMDGPRHDLYLLGTDGLNELEILEVLP